MNLIELTEGSISIDELTRCHKCFHKRRQIHWESVRTTVKTVFVVSFFIKWTSEKILIDKNIHWDNSQHNSSWYHEWSQMFLFRPLSLLQQSGFHLMENFYIYNIYIDYIQIWFFFPEGLYYLKLFLQYHWELSSFLIKIFLIR